MSGRRISSGRAVPPSRRSALRAALAGLGSMSLAGCDKLSNNASVVGVLERAQSLSRAAQRVVAGPGALAQEFTEADIAAHFKGNGTLMPASAAYQRSMKNGFRDWKLVVGGLVERPVAFSLDELRAMPSRTQITRHDCVEGWSTIGKWKGVQLAHVLDLVRPTAKARYVVFRCADAMDGGDDADDADDAEAEPEAKPDVQPDGRPNPKAGESTDKGTADDSTYYESIDLDEARHLQTLLAYDLNDHALPVTNGAPLRLRVERQLGYKQAKYLMRLELVESFAAIRGGAGGYWEDNGYEWYAGI